MKINYLLLFLFVSVVIYAGVEFSTGISGTTLLNGQGCTCHNGSADPTVDVWIEGPDTLYKGETAEYHIYLTGGPMVKGGFNVAARFSTFTATDPGTEILNGELTHNQARIFTGDTVSWYFNFTASDSLDWDTLYSVANSVNGDGIPNTADRWNFGPNFPVRLLDDVPVELLSFNAASSNGSIVLTWTTSTETNNKGFEIQRSQKSASKSRNWERIGFVEGNGTTTLTHQYSYSDNNNISGKIYYRLKQIDFNGAYTYSQAVEVISSPLNFSLEQNYPNPFNPSTNLSFVIGKSSFVTLKVYNIIGKEVATLVSENKNPGKYNLKFNASKLTSGVYIYTLTAGNFSASKKLLLLK
jgi:hypothetical protein